MRDVLKVQNYFNKGYIISRWGEFKYFIRALSSTVTTAAMHCLPIVQHLKDGRSKQTSF